MKQNLTLRVPWLSVKGIKTVHENHIELIYSTITRRVKGKREKGEIGVKGQFNPYYKVILSVGPTNNIFFFFSEIMNV